MYPYCTNRFWIAYSVAGSAATRKLSPMLQLFTIFSLSTRGPPMMEVIAMSILPSSVAITTEDLETPLEVNLEARIGCSPNCRASRLQ
jgi:hypothetical protein